MADTRDIQLITLSPATEAALAADPAYTKAMAEEDWPGLAEVIRRYVERESADDAQHDEAPGLGGFVAVDSETREVVGSCGFKAPPSAAGDIEIAYFTYPGHEGQGYATAMASQLIALATDSASVRRIIAHTLPEPNASTRVLEKVGMTHAGEVTDPEDGKVWRWEAGVDS